MQSDEGQYDRSVENPVIFQLNLPREDINSSLFWDFFGMGGWDTCGLFSLKKGLVAAILFVQLLFVF